MAISRRRPETPDFAGPEGHLRISPETPGNAIIALKNLQNSRICYALM
jgi:hypothetical protein